MVLSAALFGCANRFAGFLAIPERFPDPMNNLNLPAIELCIRAIAKVSLDNEKYFCDLDGEMGDADFGKTLADGFRAILAQLDGSIDRSSIGAFLIKIGATFAGSAGGTSGPVWGTAFLRAGTNSKGKQEVTLAEMVVMGRAAIQGMMARGNATQGDKTLLDAVIPAVEVVTTSYFTQSERFDEAILVVSSLGDPFGERSILLANRTAINIGEYVRVRDLEEIVSSVHP